MTTTTNHHHHHAMCACLWVPMWHTVWKSFSVHAKKFRRVISWIFNFNPWHMHPNYAQCNLKRKISLNSYILHKFFPFFIRLVQTDFIGNFFVLCNAIYNSVSKLTENCVGSCRIRSKDTSNQYGAKLGKCFRSGFFVDITLCTTRWIILYSIKFACELKQIAIYVKYLFIILTIGVGTIDICRWYKRKDAHSCTPKAIGSFKICSTHKLSSLMLLFLWFYSIQLDYICGDFPARTIE